MKLITIYHYGKIRDQSLRSLIEYYQKLSGRKFELKLVMLKDVQQKVAAQNLPDIPLDRNFLLTESGKLFSTREFSKKIAEMLDRDEPINFTLANAFGFSDEVKAQAVKTLSLSPLTLPHELALLVLCEQLFRVSDILSGGNYHK